MYPITLEELIQHSKIWGVHDIPLYVEIEGHKLPLRLGYCNMTGLVFKIEPKE